MVSAPHLSRGAEIVFLKENTLYGKLEFEKEICHLGLSSTSGEIAAFEYSVTAISRLRCSALEIITCKHTTINENVL